MLSIMVISFFSLAWLSCSQPLVIKSWLKPGIIPMIWENGPIFITFVNCSYLHMEWSYSVSLGAFVDGNECLQPEQISLTCLSGWIHHASVCPWAGHYSDLYLNHYGIRMQHYSRIIKEQLSNILFWPSCSSPTRSTKVSRSPMPEHANGEQCIHWNYL